ncbi:MAG: hypothetical protein C0520_01535 [Sphingopyxis sp.]|nr:hypothetical protein [Sphingopyxis sp.]
MPGTSAVAYVNANAFGSDGKADNRGSAAINGGAFAVIRYDVSLTRNYAGIAGDLATCKKLEAVVVQHAKSILAANFPDVKPESLKPVAIPDAIFSTLAPSNNVSVAKVIAGTTAPNLKCVLRVHTPAYQGTPLKLEVIAAYKK